jgi:hypothetical protein
MRARIRDRLAQLHAQRQAAFDMTVLWNKTDNQGAIDRTENPQRYWMLVRLRPSGPLVVEGGGDAAVGCPDLFREAGELG